MEIHTFIQIKRLKLLLYCLCAFTTLIGCNNSSSQKAGNKDTEEDYSTYVHESISVKQALEIAKKENKMLWTVIGGTEDCGYTVEFLKILKKTGFFEKYNDKFIFHACNPSVPGNYGYVEVFRSKITPNAYIFDSDGSIISLFDFTGESPIAFANRQVELVLSGRFQNGIMIEDYSMGGARLLLHLKDFIEIAQKSLSNNKDTLLSAQAGLFEIDSLSRNYYYYYLLTRISDKLGDTLLRNRSAESAYQLFVKKGVIIWTFLNDSIKQFSPSFREDLVKTAKLIFEDGVIKLGEIALGKVHEYTLSFENKGNSPLVILGAHTSCDCVRIHYPKTPVLPGEEGVVKIEYNAIVKGKIQKSILFQSNAANRVQRIDVEGEVV